MAQSPSGIPSTNNSVMSITRSARTEPFDLQVARGQVAGHSVVSLFGYQAAVTATAIPIWENATIYTYPTTAQAVTVASSSAADVAPAAVQINGLDANFNPISEVIILTGTAGVVSLNKYLRINSLNMVGVASGQTSNAGTITAKNAGATATYAQINTGIGKSQSTIYTVPAGFTFYLDLVEANTSNSYTGSTIVTYKVQATDNTAGVTRTILQQPFVSIYTINRASNPFAYTEKTDLQFQLNTNTGSIAAGVIVTGKLISNGI
jgi:hypothetical protein